MYSTFFLKITVDLVRRVEKAGFKALVFTVDDPNFGKRCANIRNQFKLPPHLNLANFTNYSDPNFDPRLRDPTLTWEGISWLKTITNLPIIVKGILHPEDAILAVKQGVKGDFFQNHSILKGTYLIAKCVK